LPPPAWPVVLLQGVEAALGLYALLSIHNSRRRQAVIEFNAVEYRSETGIIPSGQPRLLDRAEVNNICKRLEDVQGLTDEAAKEAGKKDSYPRPSEYGTAVHSKLKIKINGPDPTKVKDQNFKAEVSYLKDHEETYGRKDSIRVDVYENVNSTTVCVYDIKTGRSGLSPKRIAEIAMHVFRTRPVEAALR
jgi:hypothetical protein